jgi:Na+-driven multidrug efflux pump
VFKTKLTTQFLINEKRNRKFLLEGNLWKVIFYFTFPIIIYCIFQNASELIDLFILKRNQISDNQLTFVSRVNLFKGILIPFGISIATGGVILVGRAYGQNNVNKMQLYLAKTFVISILTGFILVFFCIFLFQSFIVTDILKISKNHIEKNEGIKYYNLIILSLVCIIINTVFLGLERAKGNNKIAFFLNILTASIKIIFSFAFFHYWNNSMASLAYATLFSNGIVTLFVLWFLFFDSKNPFRIMLTKISFDKEFLKKLFKLAIPVCASISIYSVGKLIVSIIVKECYGDPQGISSSQIGANLALAVTINNIFYNAINSFSDSQNAIISQNLGHNNLNRVFEAFKKIIFCMFVLALIGSLINIFGYKLILPLFHDSPWEKIPILEQDAFRTLLFFETTSLWLSCGSIIMFNFLLAFKRVWPSVYLNFLRSLIRIFFIFLFSKRFLNQGVMGVGLSIFLSNFVCFIVTLYIFVVFYLKLKLDKTFEQD